jgi:shikimate kinase
MPSPRPDRSIALVGLPGAGKTCVGRRLARRLGLPFVDSDAEIERESGLGVAEIFDRHGEAQFREAERASIAALVAGPPRVIATGGGAFADAQTRRHILDRCVAIWLDADPDTLAGRVGRNGGRPLLRGQDSRQALTALAERRNPFYAEAHIRLDSGAMSEAAVVERIVEVLER